MRDELWTGSLVYVKLTPCLLTNKSDLHNMSDNLLAPLTTINICSIPPYPPPPAHNFMCNKVHTTQNGRPSPVHRTAVK